MQDRSQMNQEASSPLLWKKGFVSLDGGRFNPGRAMTRIELAQAMNALVDR